jgi:hypothetical protein
VITLHWLSQHWSAVLQAIPGSAHEGSPLEDVKPPLELPVPPPLDEALAEELPLLRPLVPAVLDEPVLLEQDTRKHIIGKNTARLRVMTGILH